MGIIGNSSVLYSYYYYYNYYYLPALKYLETFTIPSTINTS